MSRYRFKWLFSFGLIINLSGLLWSQSLLAASDSSNNQSQSDSQQQQASSNDKVNQAKSRIKARYQPSEQSQPKPQLNLFPDLSPQGVVSADKSQPISKAVVLDNDYPLPKADTSKPAKRQLKASYSENGIVSDLGVEKRKVYQYEKNGITAFSDSEPGHNNYRILLYECFACRPDSTIDWYKTPLFKSEYASLVARAAHRYQIDPALIKAVIHAESAFRTNVVSKAGAMGLMQLMPATAKDMNVRDAFQAEQNIDGGSRYLAKLLAQFNGDIDLACAAYNAGPTTVKQYNGIPPYPETQAYVQRVKILYNRYRKVS
ncbi:lytic transglycosylase domain-containing protein [Shewanella aestuarii]|uniref:Lytic transglycosylase domain-containing protein n=1 Tax=Shewanella aestuarii TaxID=1028752 RepID=A0A6G9QQ93_9GAMM|nr:lytic transglycosylase domain-containing protein [Shewanella aestuarii]